jgi:hypothetical protein
VTGCDSGWPEFLGFSVYYHETILFVNEKGNCVKNDKFHAHNTRSSLDFYHQYVHTLGIHNSRPTIAGGKFYNKLPAYIKQIKDKSLFKRKLKQLLINRCYYFVEDFMNDDFTYNGCWLTFHFSWLTFQFFCLVLSHDIHSNKTCNSALLFISRRFYVILGYMY